MGFNATDSFDLGLILGISYELGGFWKFKDHMSLGMQLSGQYYWGDFTDLDAITSGNIDGTLSNFQNTLQFVYKYTF